MLFNIGRYELLLTLVVVGFVVGVPLISWWLARRRKKRLR